MAFDVLYTTEFGCSQPVARPWFGPDLKVRGTTVSILGMYHYHAPPYNPSLPHEAYFDCTMIYGALQK